MKHIIMSIAIALLGLCAFAQIDTVEVGGTPSVASAPGKVVGIRVLSSVSTGTAQVKSVSTLPVVEIVDHITATTNFTYSYNYTTNGVRSTVTNAVVTVHTNHVPTATSTVVVTNSIGGSITCASGVGSDNPTNTFIIPGEPIFYDGTAKGRVLLIIER